ncbi:TIGR02281 family clan AA aspartic protease [Paracoccus sp. SCSIO 75233]|uniref:retropepsin-like aspartic protease family protein n=1 Tax=Paracoccus sp. SCSIO 75233 TaxID=3017782 RepID=UPI0022F03414|nr:TIGR02281 family clan AA aspartic protease [Paracoccus sp. SCSIO 75233]WBU53310.1 TIGR02281 family clan AA aspartic protease [Paracoccus sp. SCSIO 75233]
MSGDYMRLAYLLLLLVAVVGYLIVEMRSNPGKSARQLLAWGLIILGLMAGYGLWEDIRSDVAPSQIVEGRRIELPMRHDGHFQIEMDLNDVPVQFMIDTGATEIALRRRDAERIGIDAGSLRYIDMASTANGVVYTAPVRIEHIRIGEIVDENVPASVVEGDLDISLLGMSYLRRFARVSFEDDVMVLER